MSEETDKINDYASLKKILSEAYEQSASGKGYVHHSDGKPWEEQLINIIQGWGIDYARGQAVKKIVESQVYFQRTGNTDGAIAELLGAIVYCAAAIHNLRQGKNDIRTNFNQR